MSKVKIILNGEERTIDQGTTLSQIVDELELDLEKIAIEKDLEVINQNNYANTVLNEGCNVEIVHFIGGG